MQEMWSTAGFLLIQSVSLGARSAHPILVKSKGARKKATKLATV
jgi:hypothetical protein